MEDDSDTEMADYGTDFSDDVDRNFDATQGTSTTRIHCRNTITPILCRRQAQAIPHDPRMFQVAAEVLALSIAVGDCTTIAQSRSKLSGACIVILTAVLKSQLDHENPELLVRVMDVDEPGTGRTGTPRTLML